MNKKLIVICTLLAGATIYIGTVAAARDSGGGGRKGGSSGHTARGGGGERNVGGGGRNVSGIHRGSTRSTPKIQATEARNAERHTKGTKRTPTGAQATSIHGTKATGISGATPSVISGRSRTGTRTHDRTGRRYTRGGHSNRHGHRGPWYKHRRNWLSGNFLTLGFSYPWWWDRRICVDQWGNPMPFDYCSTYPDTYFWWYE
ncbi:hypothetical protein CVU75_02615 [Candidatus Dependentiae bacterium HGW-Dependentiae-1]|nr:MAG: hypothetical protein CVU75_02615 [Candidatus Dependentiae bacterium HGW-Dependentiae-1]